MEPGQVLDVEALVKGRGLKITLGEGHQMVDLPRRHSREGDAQMLGRTGFDRDLALAIERQHSALALDFHLLGKLRDGGDFQRRLGQAKTSQCFDARRDPQKQIAGLFGHELETVALRHRSRFVLFRLHGSQFHRLRQFQHFVGHLARLLPHVIFLSLNLPLLGPVLRQHPGFHMTRNLLGLGVARSVHKHKLLRCSLGRANQFRAQALNIEAGGHVRHPHLRRLFGGCRLSTGLALQARSQGKPHKVLLLGNDDARTAHKETPLILAFLDHENGCRWHPAPVEQRRAADDGEPEVLLHIRQLHRMGEIQFGGDLMHLRVLRIGVEFQVAPLRAQRRGGEGPARVFQFHRLLQLCGIQRDDKVGARRPVRGGLEHQARI